MRASASIRRHAIWLLLALVVLLPGCASTGNKASALERAQYAWSAAVRWNDFEAAWEQVDPDYRRAHPATDLDFARYAQLQVTSYRDAGLQVGADEATRQIQIGVVNRHTMAERTVRYTERWRWDPQAGTWWIVDGLPDLWAGQ